MPSPSTGTGTQVSPLAVSWSRRPIDPGSSTAMDVVPPPQRTSATRRLAWAKPLTTMARSGGASGSPHPAQVAGEFLAQAGQPGRVAVAELVVGQRQPAHGPRIQAAARGTCRLTAARVRRAGDRPQGRRRARIGAGHDRAAAPAAAR